MYHLQFCFSGSLLVCFEKLDQAFHSMPIFEGSQYAFIILLLGYFRHMSQPSERKYRFDQWQNKLIHYIDWYHDSFSLRGCHKIFKDSDNAYHQRRLTKWGSTPPVKVMNNIVWGHMVISWHFILLIIKMHDLLSGKLSLAGPIKFLVFSSLESPVIPDT